MIKTFGLAAGALVLAACGGSGASVPQAAVAPVTLELGSKGDGLAFDKTELSAAAGAKITVKFKNNASAASGNKHNFVLVKPADATAVAADGIAAGEASGYLKADDKRVIAHTKLLAAGESGEVTFDAPAAGAYEYMCSFPGHNVVMKGTLIIK
ncbi:MAG: plastocyanin/azurin family copper-binding protein [Chloroflexi bacterium]|nr:plastocyanin/azurin family copper-binding protein [Chloroflexota bacterium]